MNTSIQLNQQHLNQVEQSVSVPTYDRNTHKIGIVHIGVGGFHRSHQAYYMHKLQEISDASKWSICGIGLREGDRKMHDILKKQDHLYTLLIKHPDGKIAPEVIGSIIDFNIGIDNPEPVIAS